MTANPYPTIDANLFVNAYASGMQLGKAIPSEYSSFTNALISGLDDEQKAKTARDQDTLLQNQISQIPTSNAIQNAEAVKQTAIADAIKADPQGFQQAQIDQQKAIVDKYNQEQQLQAQETKWTQIMQTGTSAQKAQAIAGGEFADLYANKPHLYEAGYASAGGLDKADRDTVYAADVQKKTAEYQAQTAAKQQDLFDKYQDPYHKNDELNALKSTGGISDAELLRYGKVIALNLPQQRIKTTKEPEIDDKTGEPIIDKKGNTLMKDVPVKDENGGYVMEDQPYDPNDLTTQKQSRRPVLVYKNQPYELSTQALKDFSNFQSPFLSVTGRAAGQAGGNVLSDGEKLDKQKEISNAALQAQIDDQNKNAATYDAAYNEHLAVKNPYKAAADQVKNDRAAYLESNRKIDQAVEKAAPPASPTPKETFDPSTVVHEKYVAPIATRVPTASATPDQTSTPDGRPTPFESPAPLGTQAPQPTDTPDPNAKLKEDQEIAVAKAKFILSKQPTKAATAAPLTQKTPVQQATTIAAPADIPQHVQLHMPGPPPSEQVIQRVVSSEATKGLSAGTQAIISAESQGINSAVSPVRYDTNGRKLGGVKGIAQMTEGTANDIVEGGANYVTDPNKAALMAAYKVERMFSDPTYGNNPMLVSVGYNGGESLAATAVKLAGSTDWSDIQKVLPEAARIHGFGASKVKEIESYVYRVASYYPAFVRTNKDLDRLSVLRDQKLVSWQDPTNLQGT